MMLFNLLASIQMNENDRRAVLVLVIILMVLFLIIGLLGMGIRAAMQYQGKAADTMMYNVSMTHVVNSPKEYRKLGYKKNNRRFFEQALLPIAIIFTGLIIWIVYSAIVNGWKRNIFVEFTDLFFLWHFEDPSNYVKVFGITLLAKWPEPIAHHPEFNVHHLASYIETILIIGGSIYFLVVVQAYLARFIAINRRSREIFETSLEGVKVNQIDPNSIPKENPQPNGEGDMNKQSFRLSYR